MNYDFPFIKHIDDVLPHVKDYSEFIVADKGMYTVINYAVDTGNTFKIIEGDEHGSYIRRECRGIKFDNKTGNIIARPFHKFANLNQWEETRFINIDIDDIKHFMVKEDGSMIHPFIIDDNIYYATKMGVTDTITQMEKEIRNIKDIEKYCRKQIGLGYTPIFEYVSPNNKIVLKYDEPKLILTALRHMETGEYVDIHYGETPYGLKVMHNIDVVKTHQFNKSFDRIIDDIDVMHDIEGFVIRMNNGHMFKIKTNEYVAIHKAKEQILSDRLIIKMMYDNTIDDVYSKLDENDRKHVANVIDEYNKLFSIKRDAINVLMDKICRSVEGNAKQLAIIYMNKFKDKQLAKFMFEYNKNGNINDYMVSYAIGHLNQNIRYEEFKEWLKGEVE